MRWTGRCAMPGSRVRREVTHVDGMSPPATLLMWFQLRSPELAEDFERLMTEDRDIVRGSLDTVSDWRLTRPADVPGQSIGQADYVLIAEIVEVERFEQQASEHVQRVGRRLGASRLEPGDARPASRPLKTAVGGATLRLAHNRFISPRTLQYRTWNYRRGTLTRSTNAADELARRGCGRDRNGGDDARAAQLDKRLFDSKYDDVEILGKLVTRGDDWRPIGVALHMHGRAHDAHPRDRWTT